MYFLTCESSIDSDRPMFSWWIWVNLLMHSLNSSDIFAWSLSVQTFLALFRIRLMGPGAPSQPQLAKNTATNTAAAAKTTCRFRRCHLKPQAMMKILFFLKLSHTKNDGRCSSHVSTFPPQNYFALRTHH